MTTSERIAANARLLSETLDGMTDERRAMIESYLYGWLVSNASTETLQTALDAAQSAIRS